MVSGPVSKGVSQGTPAQEIKKTNPNIVEDIHQTAGYHPPATYAFGGASPNASGVAGSVQGLLSFYRDLVLEPDSQAASFIPMSAVTSGHRNTKLFAVGIIPPTQNITGRLLDRSRAVQRPTIPHNFGVEGVVGVPPGPPETFSGIPPKLEAHSNRQIQTLKAVARTKINQFLTLARRQGIALMVNEGHRSLAKQQAAYNKGRDANGTKTGAVVTNAKPGNSWHNYGLAVDVLIVRGGKQSGYIDKKEQNELVMLATQVGLTWGPSVEGFPPDDVGHFHYTGGLTFHQVQNGAVPPGAVGFNPVAGDAGTSGWQAEGKDAKDQAAKDQIELDRTDLQFRRQVGLAHVIQKNQIAAAQAALNAMASAPPLRLLVNPNKFAVASTKLVSDTSWSRSGPILEFWGDEQDKITGTGQVSAFYSLDAHPGLGKGGPGLTRAARNFSAGWQNLQSLYLMYKNNGALFLPDSSQMDRDIVLSTVGSVYLFYDHIMYIGSFDSFNMTESADKPFTLEYNFAFTVRAAFLLEFPNALSYGAASQSFVGGLPGLPAARSTAETESLANLAQAESGTLVDSSNVQGTLDSAEAYLLDSF